MAIKTYEDIPGYFDYQEFYKHVVEKFSGGTFVEVGAWFGRSTAYFAQLIIDSSKSINLYVVDTWKGSANEPGHLNTVANRGGSIYRKFVNNMRELGVDRVITTMEMLSIDAALEFEDASVDMVFLDAEHSYTAVKEDISAWYPKVRTGGILAGHDYCLAWPGVKQAVDELLPSKHNFKSTNVWMVER